MPGIGTTVLTTRLAEASSLFKNRDYKGLRCLYADRNERNSGIYTAIEMHSFPQNLPTIGFQADGWQ